MPYLYSGRIVQSTVRLRSLRKTVESPKKKNQKKPRSPSSKCRYDELGLWRETASVVQTITKGQGVRGCSAFQLEDEKLGGFVDKHRTSNVQDQNLLLQ
jgi:hypothetical protein